MPSSVEEHCLRGPHLPSAAVARPLALATLFAFCAVAATAAQARLDVPGRLAQTATLELILTGNEGSVTVGGHPECDVSDTRNNGRPCSYTVPHDQNLTLSAEGSGFVGWSVAECPGRGPCTVKVDSNRTVVGTFTPTSLTVVVEGSGLRDGSGNPLVDPSGDPIRGRVRSADGRIDCSGSRDCRDRSFSAFAEVVLTASPASEFERWSGACQEEGTSSTCTVLLSGDDVVGAKFRDDPDTPELIPPRMRAELRVVIEPPGAGTVRSSRSRFSQAIDCGNACRALFQQGEKVTLEAAAFVGVGARFVSWRGGAPYCGATQACRRFPAFNTTSIHAVFAYPGRCERKLEGTARANTFDGGPGGEHIVGRGGADRLRGHDGDDCLEGGNGNDRLEGGRGVDKLNGGAGADSIDGGPGSDVIAGGAGKDVVTSRDGERDTVACGNGRDTVRADRLDVLSGCERVSRG